jgi:hypothetical protein
MRSVLVIRLRAATKRFGDGTTESGVPWCSVT